MDCSRPPQLSDDQLLSALDGATEPDIHEHLADCASCAARLDGLRHAEESLKVRLHRWDCPTPQRLGDYHLGLASAAEADMIGRHLELCMSCSAEIELLRAFLGASHSMPAVPQPDVRRAQPWLGELIARVLPPAPALALRGVGARSLTAEAGHTTIILDVQPGAEGWVTLRGQILEADQDRWVGALVELRQAGALATTTMIDEVGGFSCKLLQPEPAELRITPEIGRTVVIPQIELAS